MTVVLIIAAYFGVMFLCVYVEARLCGRPGLNSLWVMWPIMLPILAMVRLTDAAEQAGVRHGDAQ